MMKNNIMLKKIILPVILLIFTQQNFYGMNKINNSVKFWENINNWVNGDEPDNDNKYYPKLLWLWAFLDNVSFQYGNSKIWKHGEAYYGLSNGIGFFPSFLNFGWMKIGIIDLHIDLIIDIIHFCRNNVWWKVNHDGYENVWIPLLFYDLLGQGTHFLSFKIFNGIKIRLISIFLVIIIWSDNGLNKVVFNTDDTTQKSWYYRGTADLDKTMSMLYCCLCPRIEINIPGIIDYFKNS